jgi:hypothetical protein
VQWTAGTWLLASTVVGFASATVLFEVQEWLRRRRQSNTLKAALRGELERAQEVFAPYVFLWEHQSHPTQADVAELQRLVAQLGSYANTLRMLVGTPADQVTEILRTLPGGGVLHGPSLPTPILTAVLESPPEGWPAERLHRLSWLYWQLHQVTDARRSMDRWQEAISTAKDYARRDAEVNYERAESMFKKQVVAALAGVREVLALLELRASWCSALCGAVTRLWRRAPHVK